MVRINDTNSIKYKLCQNKSINISEIVRNRIIFQQVHENNKEFKEAAFVAGWSKSSLSELEEAMEKLEKALKRSSVHVRR